MIAACINILMKNNKTWGDYVSYILSCTFLIALLTGFTILFFYFIISDINVLKKNLRLKDLVGELNINKKSAYFYFHIYILRRIILVVSALFIGK